MFEKIFQKKESIELINTHESDVALRLMFEIAISDGKLDTKELNLIRERASKIISGNEKTSTIIKKIIDESEESVSLYPTVKKINETHTRDEKYELLKSLWELVAIDNIIDMYEESLYYKIAELIKVPRAKANQIKHHHN
ncbi:MAG: hypothetical protein CMD68_02240 [Gammaproteobacteria bacterium]|nr:hypothetical protein [Gammaproteobacteria bacterium]|tara:strand:+ start:154 stop:573 length:420 start_codon:yes stop_codon:yes gene_type:complete